MLRWLAEECGMMQKSATKLLAGIVAVVLLGMISTCAEERSLSPQPPPLRIYAGALDFRGPYPYPTTVFVYDADSLTLVDSFPLPVQNLDLVASEDGCWLYALTKPESNIRVLWRVNTVTHVAESLYSQSGRNSDLPFQMFPLNHGSWLLVARDLISITDGSLDKTISDSLVPFTGVSSGTAIAVGTGDQVIDGELITKTLHGYDFETDSIWGAYQPHLLSGVRLGEVRYAVLHPDMRRVLAMGRIGSRNTWFVIGDLLTGETLLQNQMVYSAGEILITPDGRHAVVTDPSIGFILDSHPTLDVFDLDQMALVKRFIWILGEAEKLFTPSQLYVVPGTDRIVAAPPSTSVRGLMIVDLGDLDTIAVLQFDPYDFYRMGGLAVGYGRGDK